VNRLHALFRYLIPGGAPTALTAKAAPLLLRSVRPARLVERTRQDLAHDTIGELRAIDASLADIKKRMSEALNENGSQLRGIDCGCRILRRVRYWLT